MFDLNRLKDMKRIESNGYYEYYIPEHHLASGAGIVYEHQLVAEAMLGRELKDEEVIHHKDRNRKNNAFDNLIVFKTVGDHTAYHNGAKIIKENDVYVAIKHSKVNENGRRISSKPCPICGGEMATGANMCWSCANKKRAEKSRTPSKDTLYTLLLNNSMCAIGRKYNVSDNAVRKWCKKYGLPYRKNDINKLREDSKHVNNMAV